MRNEIKSECFDCKLDYEKFPCDMVIDDVHWRAIAPIDGNGLLCPNCICKRLYSKFDFVCVYADIDVALSIGTLPLTPRKKIKLIYTKKDMCLRKVKHKTKEKAISEYRRIKNELPQYLKNTLRIYRCPWCDGYHLGKERSGRIRAERLELIKKNVKKITDRLTKFERKELGRFIGYLKGQV